MPKWIHTGFWQGLLLSASDVATLYVAIGAVHYFRLGYWLREPDWQLGAIVMTIIASLYVLNVYHLNRITKPVRLALRSFSAVAVSGALIASVVYVTKSTEVSTVLWRGNLPIALFVFALWVALVRYVGQTLFIKFTREPRWLVFGEGMRTDRLFEDRRRSLSGGELLRLDGRGVPTEEMRLIVEQGETSVMMGEDLLFEGKVDGIIVANDGPLPDDFLTQLMRVRLSGLPIMDLADYYEQFLFRVPVMHLKDGWFAMSEGFALLHHDIQMKIKRIIDVVIALIGLVIFAPVLLLVAALVRMTSAGPAFYSQTRTGYGGRDFQLHKFRTMIQDAEKDGPQWTRDADPRITKLGGVLRKMRIDELPQLWNVLVGHMSFIGPRPERPDFNIKLEEQIPYYDLRHLVKPGITGWAQVMYTYGASVEDARNKLEYDLYYIKNYSLALDVYIALRTLRVVFSWAGR